MISQACNVTFELCNSTCNEIQWSKGGIGNGAAYALVGAVWFAFFINGYYNESPQRMMVRSKILLVVAMLSTAAVITATKINSVIAPTIPQNCRTLCGSFC